MKVKLTKSEMFFAAMIGVMRNIEALEHDRKDKHGHDGPGWNIQVEGACGEMASAKAQGLYWDGSVNTFKDGDDICGCQVRTRSKSHYELIIRKDDNPQAIFNLVTGLCPNYNVVG